MNNEFKKICNDKYYNIFINNKILIIQGKTKEGNDYIIDNTPIIIKRLLNLDLDVLPLPEESILLRVFFNLSWISFWEISFFSVVKTFDSSQSGAGSNPG